MELLRGKGAQINVPNKFLDQSITFDEIEGLDEEFLLEKPKTQIFYETPKTIISSKLFLPIKVLIWDFPLLSIHIKVVSMDVSIVMPETRMSIGGSVLD